MALNLHFEMFGAFMLFAIFWLLFYKLNFQGSKTRLIPLVIGMALYRPLLSVPLPDLLRILLPFVMIAALAFLAGGRKKSVWVTAIYFSGATVFVDTIVNAMILGLSGNWHVYGGLAIYIILFLAALVYYLIMRAVPEEALDRIPLRVWIVLLLFQPAGAAAFYIPLDSLLAQRSAGSNNFLFLGSFLLILFVLNLLMFYLFVNLADGYNARLLAGELNKTPPVYSPQSGLSPEFMEKYGLTNREAEIMAAVLQGKSDKEVAVSLFIAVDTVKTHLKNIYRKTGAPGRYALMALTGIGK